MLRSLVFAAVAVLASTPPGRADEPGPRTGVEDAASAHAIPDLHRMLMDKLDAMNAKDEGIFRDDITPSLAPYFPVGQPMAETKRIIAAQNRVMAALGEKRRLFLRLEECIGDRAIDREQEIFNIGFEHGLVRGRA